MGYLSFLKDFVRGLLMGAAEIVPGVSGGTIALIVGVYEQLIAAISHTTSAVLCLIQGDVRGTIDLLRAIEWRLIIPLLIGMVSVVVAGARFIPDILEAYPVQSRALFFGLIAGSLIIPWRRIGQAGVRPATLAGAAAVIAFLLAGLPTTAIADPSLVYVFFSAAVAICALILPGVSGAYFLLVFGIYEASLIALRTLDAAYVATFIAGAAFGLGFFARLLTVLLKRFYDITMAVLVGLMLGSLRALWPWLREDRSLMLPEAGDPLASVIVLALTGAAGVLVLYVASLRFTQSSESGTESASSPLELSARSDS